MAFPLADSSIIFCHDLAWLWSGGGNSQVIELDPVGDTITVGVHPESQSSLLTGVRAKVDLVALPLAKPV